MWVGGGEGYVGVRGEGGDGKRTKSSDVSMEVLLVFY